MIEALLERAIADPEIDAYQVGYIASEAGFPFGRVTADLLNRATGAHDMQQNDIFPWISDPGKPDEAARNVALSAIACYRLETTDDYANFINGSDAAYAARMNGKRI